MAHYHSTVALCLALVSAAVVYGFYRRTRERDLLAWARILSVLAASSALQLGFSYLGLRGGRLLSDALMFVAAGAIFGLACRPGDKSRYWLRYAVTCLLVLVWCVALVIAPDLTAEWVSPLFAIAAGFCGSAIMFGRAAAGRRLPGALLVALACLVMAGSAITGSAAFLRGYATASTAGAICGLLLLAVGAIALVQEEQQVKIEEHLLALSTLAFARGPAAESLPELLGQILARILNICNVKDGIIWVVGGERQPAVEVVRGFPPDFARVWDDGAGRRKASAVIDKMGGLVILRDLDRPAKAGRLETDTDYHDFRAMLSEGGAQGLFALSLRTKSAVRGYLILCQTRYGSFSPAAMRLLATFGSQLALAVENFLVIRESSRRAEELRLFNQIGQAMSSTLNPDQLLRVIHQEVQKLLDARNFYIALYDAARNETCFELEVEDGEYLPKHKAKGRNALIERVAQTGRPLLLKRGSADLAASGRPSRCWLGVPILLHDRPIGVVSVRSSEREEAYDEGHLEVLQTLAAQAAIALENSRMFVEEHRRQRHLSFLNRVARIAISNMNSDEMLGEIASEMQRNLEYDHISIGVLNYETQRIEVKAAGGLRVQSEGCHVSLGSGIIGRVARSGEMVLADRVGPGDDPQTLLRDARSVLCLPIIHGAQTLGVLNIESVREAAFPPEDVILLRTLADQLAAALHNALVFRQVQEQAITDGLTGMKTRRYFDEALVGEWKRSIRSKRPFSLILMDLDRFKPINDQFGHLEGDLVLVRIGKILEERCRRSNVVARYGGDEFIILMAEASTDQALILAERLRAWIAEDPPLRERGLTASFGLATYPLHGTSVDALLKGADVGLYLAKGRGGDTVAIAEQFETPRAKDSAHELLDEIRALAANLVTGPDVAEGLIEKTERGHAALAGQPGEVEHALTEALISLADAMGRKLYGPLAYTRSLGFHAMRLAALLGLPARDQELMRTAGSLHDLGFLALPEPALSPDSFRADQTAEVHAHVEVGARLLAAAQVSPEVIQAICHHHDISSDLDPEAVPLHARILAVVDAFDMQAGQTPDGEARSRAVEQVQGLAGTRLDPLVVAAFVSLAQPVSVQPESETHGSPQAPSGAQKQ